MSNLTGESISDRSALGNSVAQAKGDMMAVAKLTFSTEPTGKAST